MGAMRSWRARMGRLAAAAVVAALPGCSPSGPEHGNGPPNIVFVLADDLGYGELGSYGQEKISTPRLDRLAREGMRFTQHYSGSPVCAPSRGVLLTGKHTGRAYIRGNDEMAERGDVWDYARAVEEPRLEGQRPLPAGTRTLGHLLQEAGYRTAVLGKWGLGGPLTEGAPNRQGFDFFFGYNCQRQAHTYYPRHLWRNTEKVWLDNPLVVPGTKLEDGADPADSASYERFTLREYAPDLMLEEALTFIEENRDGPFFLYYATPIPHVPLQAPPQWVQRYADRFGPEKPYLGERGYFPHPAPRAAYAAMVSYLDEQVGVILDRLEQLGIRRNTLVIFSSDNGPTYNGGTDSSFFHSGGQFKSEEGWGKGSLHEGGIRVPFIASWPGRIQPGAVSDHLSAFYDVLPTLAEIAGAPPPRDTDGISFAPTMLGAGDQQEHDLLYWEFPSYGGQQAVRLGRWKGLRRGMLEGNLDLELYDLNADSREQVNVAAEHPEVVREIEAIMRREHVPSAVERFRFPVLGE